MSVRKMLSFLLNGEEVSCGTVATDATLLDFLRGERRLTGTKEGCGEGDCGACTVLVGRPRGGRVVHAPVNACIRPLASIDGCSVVTVEGLRGRHPVQAAMVAAGGSQCGFCTPGIVMALAAHRLAGGGDVAEALQGNLCRCTGYGTILAAGAAAGPGELPEVAVADDGRDVEIAGPGGTRTWLPATAERFAGIVAAHPEARIVAGATDFALALTKRLEVPEALVFAGRVGGFERIAVGDGVLRIGPTVTFADAMPVLDRVLPTLAGLWRRIGGPQVRAAGTLVGNVANGSPIGDGPPVWIALDGWLTLCRGGERRRVAVEDYFLAYGRQDRRPGEFIEELAVPLPADDAIVAAWKVSKRFDEDISTVLGAFHLRVVAGVVVAARVAFGGMAGVPKRAAAVEAALVGRPWSEATVAAGAAAVAQDFAPIDDARASAAYRLAVAQGLVRRLWRAAQGEITDVRALAHV